MLLVLLVLPLGGAASVLALGDADSVLALDDAVPLPVPADVPATEAVSATALFETEVSVGEGVEGASPAGAVAGVAAALLFEGVFEVFFGTLRGSVLATLEDEALEDETWEDEVAVAALDAASGREPASAATVDDA